MADKSVLFRDRGSEHDSKVSFAELFYDLVFVFTIIQLSHTMAHHFTPLGVAETMILVLAVWWVWNFTAWVMNWLHPECGRVRIMLFVLMFLGLLLSTSIPEAFGDKGLAFAGAYVAMQVGRSAFMVWAARGHDESARLNFLRMTCWLAVSGVFWISGALVEHEWRLGFWAVAIGIEYVSPAAGFVVPGLGRSKERDWDISGEHMAERAALFIILCLGETILATGRSFSAANWDQPAFTSFAVAFMVTLSMWWIYFRFGHRRAADLIEHTDNPGGVGRSAFTYAHIPIVVGIIVTAVGLDFLLDSQERHAGEATVSALVGGPMIYLVGNGWFKTLVSGRIPLSHVAGLALLAGLFIVGSGFSGVAVGASVVAVLVLVAFWELVALHRTVTAV